MAEESWSSVPAAFSSRTGDSGRFYRWRPGVVHAIGSFVTPDVVMNRAVPVQVVVQASNIPPGTVATVFVTS